MMRKHLITSAGALRTVLSSAITSFGSAEVALLHIIRQYHFSHSDLQRVLEHLDVSFSRVKYNAIAPFVGLDPAQFLEDIETFDLHRSRIPTCLFKSIIEDMDVIFQQYGPLSAHATAEASSRFLSPIFNRLIAEFGCSFRNLPETIIEGRVTKKGRIEHYFRAFGAISILFIEAKLYPLNDEQRFNAIAQVIAECDACHWFGALNFTVPVFGILWDGECFHFFKFEGTKMPYSFFRGVLPGDVLTLAGFELPALKHGRSAAPFIQSLRQISEVIFDLLLLAFITCIEAFRNRSIERGEANRIRRKSLDKWEDGLQFAREALECFRDAEAKRHSMDMTGANQAVLEAQTFLKFSVETLGKEHTPIMADWDDNVIEVV